MLLGHALEDLLPPLTMSLSESGLPMSLPSTGAKVNMKPISKTTKGVLDSRLQVDGDHLWDA